MVIDEQRRIAEADKMQAITELEQRSQEFLREKQEKKDLEVRRCRLIHQVDPGLKALGFNQLKVIPFKVLVSDVNLHPYIEERITSMQSQLLIGGHKIEVGAELQAR